MQTKLTTKIQILNCWTFSINEASLTKVSAFWIYACIRVFFSFCIDSIDDFSEGEAEGYDGIDEGRLVTPRKSNLNVSIADKLRIVELVSQGNSYTSVAKIVKVDRRTVARIFQRWEAECSIDRRKVTGRPRKTSERDDLLCGQDSHCQQMRYPFFQ